MLDEPTLGLAPRLKEELGEAIGRIARSGIPLILVEQDVEFLLALTDRLYLLESGKIVLEHTQGNQQLEHAQIMNMYFGGSDSLSLSNVLENER
jgi:branched-chain amino acid transport system ATP-binding protein